MRTKRKARNNAPDEAREEAREDAPEAHVDAREEAREDAGGDASEAHDAPEDSPEDVSEAHDAPEVPREDTPEDDIGRVSAIIIDRFTLLYLLQNMPFYTLSCFIFVLTVSFSFPPSCLSAFLFIALPPLFSSSCLRSTPYLIDCFVFVPLFVLSRLFIFLAISMTYNIQYVSSKLFVGGFRGKLHTGNYFRCKNKSCPFALRMEVDVVDGKKGRRQVSVCCALCP